MGSLKVRVVTAGGDPIPGKSVRAESFFSWFGLTPVGRQGETGNDGTVEFELPDESIEVYVDGELRATVKVRTRGSRHAAPWLPAPEGEFRPVLRLYQPGAGRPRRQPPDPTHPQTRLNDN